MLISLLFVGREQGMNKPIRNLAAWVLFRPHSLGQKHPVLFLSRRRGVVTGQPARRPK